MAKNQTLFSDGQIEANCVVCDAPFCKPAASRLAVCSAACKRTRSLRYGDAYRQQGRDMRAKLLDRFGGQMPTAAEIMDLIKKRKGK